MSFLRFFRRRPALSSLLDPKGRVKCAYFVCTTARSGSTLFCEGLEAAGCGAPNEYLEETVKGIWAGKWGLPAGASQLDYLRQMVAQMTGAKGVFGIKLMRHHIGRFKEELRALAGPRFATKGLPRLLEAAFPQPRYIWLRRRDKVGQAVSLARATQTGRWHSVDLTGWVGVKPQAQSEGFDFEQVDAFMRELLKWDAWWEAFFARYGITPLTLYYEDFAPRYEESVLGAIDFIGAKLEPGFKLPPPRLEKQADETSRQWAREYLAIKEAQGQGS